MQGSVGPQTVVKSGIMVTARALGRIGNSGMGTADTSDSDAPGSAESGAPRSPAAVPESVIDQARGGDQRAFDVVFATYHPSLTRYLRTVAPATADDVAAATWESVARSLHNFSGDGADFRRWLFTIARRRLVDEVRRATRRPLRVAGIEEVEARDVDAVPGADTFLDGPDWAAGVLAQVPTRQAEVVALRILGGLSVQEVAELLGITEANVRVLSHRGLQAVQQILHDSPDLLTEPRDPQISSVV